jgi:hypothetical protein
MFDFAGLLLAIIFIAAPSALGYWVLWCYAWKARAANKTPREAIAAFPAWLRSCGCEEL